MKYLYKSAPVRTLSQRRCFGEKRAGYLSEVFHFLQEGHQQTSGQRENPRALYVVLRVLRWPLTFGIDPPLGICI